MEINVGYCPGCTLPRHVLEFSRQLDTWSRLGLPLWLSLCVPMPSYPSGRISVAIFAMTFATVRRRRLCPRRPTTAATSPTRSSVPDGPAALPMRHEQPDDVLLPLVEDPPEPELPPLALPPEPPVPEPPVPDLSLLEPPMPIDPPAPPEEPKPPPPATGLPPVAPAPPLDTAPPVAGIPPAEVAPPELMFPP